MNYQIVFGKQTWQPTWQFRHDSQSVEKYDNDLPDGIYYTDGTAKLPEAIESNLIGLIETYYNMRHVEKAAHEDCVKLNSKINWLVAQANTAGKILASGKKITSQYAGKDAFGNEYAEGAEIYWLKNVGTLLV